MELTPLISYLRKEEAQEFSEVRAEEFSRQTGYTTLEEVAYRIAAYRELTAQEGNELAQLAMAFLEKTLYGNTALACTVLARLATLVPGALKGLYPQFIEKRMFWGEGVLFREADTVTRDQLFTLLKKQPDERSVVAGCLCALAWIGDTEVQKQFFRWLHDPPAWLLTFAQPLNSYTRIAGWELTDEGKRRDLYHRVCYELISVQQGERTKQAEPVKTILPRTERCGSCGRHLFTLFDIDLSSTQMKFLELDGTKLSMVMCLTDTSSGEPFFTNINLFGESNWSEADGEQISPQEDLDDWEDLPRLPYEPLTLGPARRTPYETVAAYQEKMLSQIGGHPEWAQYPEYPLCPQCLRSMVFVGQISLLDIMESAEGMLYAFLCKECGKAATTYQQT